jgi:hypothetical protein
MKPSVESIANNHKQYVQCFLRMLFVQLRIAKGTFRLFGATGQGLHRSELLQLENGFQADPKKLVSIPKEASYCEHIWKPIQVSFISRSILLGELLTSATIFIESINKFVH